jgi:hypothetical protein
MHRLLQWIAAVFLVVVAVPVFAVMPSPPTGVAVKATDANRLTISWSATPYATRYKVRNATTGIEWKDSVYATTYDWNGLTAGATYCFTVRACNDPNVCGAESVKVCGVVASPPPPPTGVAAMASSSSIITLAWNAAVGATRYKVRNKTTGAESGDIAATNTTWGGLSPSTTYCFTVIGCNVPHVCGSESLQACAKTQGSALRFDYPVGTADGTGWLLNKNGYQFLAPATYGSNCSVFHPGTDMNKGGTSGDQDLNEPVYAAADGLVVDAAWFTTWGNLIMIEHTLGDGTKVWTVYAHVSTMSVKKGDSVSRRQLIGKVGKGDGSVAAHLHFEVRKLYNAPQFFPCGKSQQFVKDNYYDPLLFISTHR